MATINGITGDQFVPSDKNYEVHRYQYALSSFAAEERMAPGLIVYPANKEEISLALEYANSQNIAVAIRTGGHQYCGASSTVAPNIQLDLSKTFKDSQDLTFFEKDGQSLIRTSVSWSLGEFSDFLVSHKAFVPHGQYVLISIYCALKYTSIPFSHFRGMNLTLEGVSMSISVAMSRLVVMDNCSAVSAF